VKDLEDPGEVLLPTGNRVLPVLAVEESRAHVPFALIDGLLPNRGQGSETTWFVSEVLRVYAPDPTHAVNCLIASRIDGLTWSG
jgi:hypothetical protein